ncbi:F0F1 ATP synthase subunit delta [Bacillus sp. HMF5848]|uniref:F0F1 ATP synthase subunit delta n=1 Tax=Bacillus sp. HMF5848 TaxID=2495421 RepID=UPI000F79BCFE|nr:F0F1 ATP synthase subunit delta [Bacillus sp. HMF5848]RSK28943.1 F0F1 ATP synthase subunit delta [Bacillus sp. HMF5848]
MRNASVAKRYGLALFTIAKEQQLIQEIENELRVVKEVFSQNKELTTLLQSPKLSLAKKKEFLKNVFTDISTNVLNTLFLLTDKQRIDQTTAVVDSYIAYANEDRGVAEATVYSVRELSTEELSTISQTFASKIGKQSLNIENVVDDSILGGVKVRIGNTIYDGSLTRKLVRIKKDIMLRRS